jgi:hypothetical protein
MKTSITLSRWYQQSGLRQPVDEGVAPLVGQLGQPFQEEDWGHQVEPLQAVLEVEGLGLQDRLVLRQQMVELHAFPSGRGTAPSGPVAHHYAASER